MSSFAVAVHDSSTMARRSLRRVARYPSMTAILVGLPVVLLLMFVYVFGQTLGAGLGPAGAGTGREAYAAYIAPGVLLLTVASAAQGTAISVALDMAAGLVARLKAMPVTRWSLLAGHAAASFAQTAGSLVVVLAVAVLVGFRPTAGPAGWLGAAGVLALFTVALTWLSVALGLAAKSPESASNTPMFLVLLPFLGSGFVPTDSLPAALRWFAEHEPFTPTTEAVRGLLLGSLDASDAALAVAWSLLIAAGSFLWATRLFERRPAR